MSGQPQPPVEAGDGLLPVEQRHRDAAALIWRPLTAKVASSADIVAGAADHNYVVQAFARFEQSLTPAHDDPCPNGEHCCCCGPGAVCCDCGEKLIDLDKSVASDRWRHFLDANPDDLTSPEDLPDHALVTFEQFFEMARDILPRMVVPAEPASTGAAEGDHLLRNVVAHATGGGVSDCTGMSLNDISVAISAHHNVIWKHAQEAAQRQPDPALAAMEWLAGQKQLELHFYSPFYGDDEDLAEEWRVEKVNGGINDREWEIVGRGETPLAALLSARAALAAPGKGES